ncbi:HpcH/HpaI aldolase family protein [Kribbella caucasensis]|uniref:HpcH/HpaI aldolase family protein n=1 Tax=Kribbella caucasensis TaxID=2512215 RepID=UPI001061607A|nr:aldolase/citrate lyase family protein [Kribbella sp. VKM Ac-2527]
MPLAEAMRRGTPLIGLVVKMPNQALVELAGYSDFDLVVIDTEHGLGDGDQLEHHLRAAQGVGLWVLVRVGTASSIEVLRALDAGADGIIVPHVNTAVDAEAAVRLAHYPPRGTRGLALSTRAGHYGSVPLAEHLRRSSEETVVIAQIEHADAIANIDAIMRTPNLTGVWLGPSDLSMSLGHPGATNHPNFVAAESIVSDAAGTHPGCALAVVAAHTEAVRGWQERGASMFLVPSPDLVSASLRSYTSGARSVLQAVRLVEKGQ